MSKPPLNDDPERGSSQSRSGRPGGRPPAPVNQDAPTVAPGSELHEIVEPLTEDSFGEYELIEVLGEGGFGIVYACEQREPIQRRVALKVLKLGMDSQEVLARFDAERQTLAVLDHPGVAKVLDAGISAKGRSYFVMEFVAGVTITEYCDTNRLDTRQRLELFIQVCHAVQHAHTKGIIHRDIKPSNILVTLVDGRPVPKVIDFGVAKAMARHSRGRTMFTEAGRFVGTPEYMSPEQAGLSPLDVDTRTDVYALGVLLYELLTGMLPLDSQRLRSAGFAEIQRLIREVDPPKPSTRIGRTTMLGDRSVLAPAGPTASDTLDQIARHRRTDPASLVRQLRGELDWITMKALEKDRSRRYESASMLAADVSHFLKNEPVLAGPPSALYKARKFAVRHRAGVLTSVLFVLVMLSGVVVLGWLYMRAETERKRADAQATRAQESLSREEAERRRADSEASFARTTLVRVEEERQRADAQASLARASLGFVTDMFSSIDPDKAHGREVTVKDMLDDAATKVARTLSEQPAAEASVRNILGQTYHKLGQFERAEQEMRSVLALRTKSLGDRDPDTLEATHNLAAGLLAQGKLEDAEKLLRQAEAGRLAAFGDRHRDTLATQSLLAYLAQNKGDYKTGETMIRSVIERQTASLGARDRDTLDSRCNLADLLHVTGQLEECERVTTLLVSDSLAGLGADDPMTLQARSILGSLLEELDRPKEAAEVLRTVVESKRRVLGPDHAGTLVSENALAITLETLGSVEEAESLMRSILEKAERTLGRQHAQTLSSMNNLAQMLRRQKKLDEAEPLYRQVLELDRQVHGENGKQTLTAEVNLAMLHIARSEHAKALALLEHAAAGLEATLTARHWMTGATRCYIGECLTALHRYDEAQAALTVSYENLSATLGETHDRTKQAAAAFVKLYEAWGKPEQAERWKAKAAAVPPAK